MVPYKYMVNVNEIMAASILTPQKVGSLSQHFDFTINPYAGCAFACSYCYVPKFPSSHEVHEWGSWVNVKMNAPELIRRERAKIFGSRIFFSSATDPYQYLELKYRLTRACLKEMLNYPPEHLTLHTRSHLMLQDIDLIRAFGDRLIVGISLPTDDDRVRKEFEPNAPSIFRRLELMRKLSENGVAVYVSMAPLLPCNPDRLVQMVSPYTGKVWVDTMRWLDVMRTPHLLDRYKTFFEEAHYSRLAQEIEENFAKQKEDYKDRRQSKIQKRAGTAVEIPRQLRLNLA